MLTWEEDVQVHALRRQGWSISAIARHLGRDRKTIRAYLRGERTPGVRVRRSPDPPDPPPARPGLEPAPAATRTARTATSPS